MICLVLHVRKIPRTEPEQLKFYPTLGIHFAPGDVKKMTAQPIESQAIVLD